MNNKVKKTPADNPVKLAVYDMSGIRVDVTNTNENESPSTGVVWVDSNDDSILSYTIRMDVESMEGISDIQFVVETSPFEELNGSSRGAPSPPTPMIPTIHTVVEKSSFVNDNVLCNGRRGHACGKLGKVQYELVTRRTQHQQDDDDNILAEIVGGYAEYHGYVTLTPKIIFKRRDDDQTKSNMGEEL